jgi:hypothetical protein
MDVVGSPKELPVLTLAVRHVRLGALCFIGCVGVGCWFVHFVHVSRPSASKNAGMDTLSQ